MPHDDGGVFGARGQFGAVVGEFTKPDLVTVFGENLLSVTRELFPATTTKKIHTQLSLKCHVSVNEEI